MRNTTKAHLALLATNVFFAINFTAIKYLINNGYAKPFGLNLIRVGVSVALLWFLFLFKPVKPAIQKKDYPKFFWCALTGVALNQLLFIKGLSLTFSIHAALLLLITPILITVIAAFVLKEKLNNYKISGLFLGILGAVVLVTSKEESGTGSNILWGDILVILNAISYTIYFVLVKPLMLKYNAIVVIRAIFTMGFFMILPFCWVEFGEINWHSFDLEAYLNLFLIVVGGTFLAYLFNVYGIKILGAAAAGNYIYSQPLFAALIAISFQGEKLGWDKILAAILIFAGVYLSNKIISAPRFKIARTKKEFEEASFLFKEYAAWLKVDLCFQNFEKELLELQMMYAAPYGGIILCKNENEYIGCVAIRKINNHTAELKRMYVKPLHQKKGLGKILLKKALTLAKKRGYSYIRLDTLNHMQPAIALYKANGFYEIEPYYHNPNEGVLYFEKRL